MLDLDGALYLESGEVKFYPQLVGAVLKERVSLNLRPPYEHTYRMQFDLTDRIRITQDVK
jgi:hypothetical protein